MRRIKVLEVIRQGQIGGGESHLADLVELTDRTEFEPVCLSFTAGEMVSRMEAMGVRCHVMETTKPFNLLIQRDIADLIREEGADIVHAHGTRAASNVLFPALRMKVPLLYTVHGWSFHNDQNAIVYSLRKWSEKFICHCASQVICVSEGNAQTGRESFGLKDPVVIKNGVNLNRFTPDRATPLRRADFGFSDTDFIVGFVARCTKQKAPLIYLEALRRANLKDIRIKGLFVGEGDMDDAVDAYVAEHHMESCLFRSHFRTDVPDLLPLMDAFCLPSLWEGLSIGLLEAMAAGRAIIATPTDGTREVITHEHNGLVVPFSSPQSVCDAMLRLRGDDALRTACGENAAHLVAERFNAQTAADKVGEIYRKLIGM